MFLQYIFRHLCFQLLPIWDVSFVLINSLLLGLLQLFATVSNLAGKFLTVNSKGKY